METKKPWEQKKMANQSPNNSNHVLWDCGSSLYDSFELKSFEKHLDSAIASRSLSMPHLSDRRRLPPPPEPPSKISRSFRRLIGAVFRHKSNNTRKISRTSFFRSGFYIVCDSSAALATISEVPESNRLSPEVRFSVRKTASDRFSAAATCVGISCYPD